MSNPIFRTIRYHQVNFWILDAFLLAALMINRYPVIPGIAVAIAAHIKLYPAILVGLWTVTKQWRAAATSLVAILFIALVQTNGSQDWTLWKCFLDAFRRFPTVMVVQVTDLRNVSIRGAVYQTLRLAELGFPVIRGNLTVYVDYVVAAFMAVAGAWFLFRVVQREIIFRRDGTLAEAVSHRWQRYRWYGHTMDAAAFAILASPLVWEHHFVVALPIALWAYATRGRERPWLIGLAAFAIFCMPTVSLYPLVYHRLVGLLMLLWLTRPDAVRAAWLEGQLFGAATIGASAASARSASH